MELGEASQDPTGFAAMEEGLISRSGRNLNFRGPSLDHNGMTCGIYKQMGESKEPLVFSVCWEGFPG